MASHDPDAVWNRMSSTQRDQIFFDSSFLSDSTSVRLLLEKINGRIGDAKRMKDEFLPTRAKTLQAKINSLSRTVGHLYMKSHRSLQTRITYDQKQRLLNRLKVNIAGISDQQKMWKHVADKAKEERKQAQRMLKVQDEFEGMDQSGGTEVARRLEISVARAMKAAEEYKEALALVVDDLKKMNKGTEYQRRVGEIDRKAWEREKARKKMDKLPKARIEEVVGD